MKQHNISAVFCPEPPDAIAPYGERIFFAPGSASRKRRKRDAIELYKREYGAILGYTCGTGKLFYGTGIIPPKGTPEYDFFKSDPNNLQVRKYI